MQTLEPFWKYLYHKHFMWAKPEGGKKTSFFQHEYLVSITKFQDIYCSNAEQVFYTVLKLSTLMAIF